MAAFHYIVRAKLIQHIKGSGEIEFFEVEDVFEDASPIKARVRAFERYQSYMDVLLEAKGLEYSSDTQARIDLNSFIDPKTSTTVQMGDREFEMSDSIGNGIGVFMVIDSPKPDSVRVLEEAECVLIHGIGNLDFVREDCSFLITNLQEEFDYYTFFKYDTAGFEKSIVFCSEHEWEEGYTEDEPSTYEILTTPFDWTGYDAPLWWRKDSAEDKAIKRIPRSIEELIAEGESNQLEFKPSLLYNFSTNRGGISIKAIIAKTIAGFLNSNGGLLLIGVKDDKSIQGLDYDYSLSEGKDGRDFFLKEYDQMMKHFLSFSVKNNVSGKLYTLDGKDVFAVSVSPSKTKPVFVNGQNGKEFYVRGEASTRILLDIEEVVNYCLERWR